ncbi:MAG: dTDP-4-dehydrorhamnose reductase [Mycobacterium sp.]
MVITGAGGQVGRALTGGAAGRGYDVVALTHRDLDITEPEQVRRHVGAGDVVVNCAAFTDVDAAESDPRAAHAINAAGPGIIARACAAAGARLVHISTDYVFAGDLRRPYEISDPCGPLSVYGRSKLDGELAVHAELPGAHVVRTSWVYTGGSGTDFVAAMRRLAGTDRTVDMVADQTGSPTYARDLVAALLEVAGGTIRAPLLHVANAGAASRFEQARAVFELLGADPQRIRPVGTDAVARPARRPVYSALSMAESVRAGLTALRPWRDALAAALAVPL